MPRALYLLVTILASILISPRVWSAESEAGTDTPSQDGTLPGLIAVAGQSMMDSHAYRDLEELNDEIGGRLTGSPKEAQAADWVLGKMHAIGLANIHREKWQLSRGWTRLSASATLLAPIERPLTISSMGWVGSTPKGGIVAEVVTVNVDELDQEMKHSSSGWAGKILLMVKGTAEPKNRALGPFLEAAAASHAEAVILGSDGASSGADGMHLTHTGAFGSNNYYDIPVVSMVAEDQHQLERFFRRREAVRMKLDVQNRVTGGPADSANVMGEIRGAERPEEVVVVGGHLDSWDLAGGAVDDGVGVVATLAAAEAIQKSGHRPRRTMRFVLFTGEEQGLVGSLAYTKSHKGEMANHVAALVLDNGEGSVVGLTMGGRDDLVAAVTKFADSAISFGKLKVDDRTDFGTDAGPFILAGLPGISMDQDSPEYKYTHHSVADTVDKVKADVLIRNATLIALTGFWIADRPQRLASPWPPEKTARMLVKHKDDEILKTYGLWPFGELGSDAH